MVCDEVGSGLSSTPTLLSLRISGVPVAERLPSRPNRAGVLGRSGNFDRVKLVDLPIFIKTPVWLICRSPVVYGRVAL